MSVKKGTAQTKLESLILYFASNIPLHLGKKKLAKLMYFVDFTAYELLQEPISGEKYMKYLYGPMPVRFYDILKDMVSKNMLEVGEQPAEFIPSTIVAKVPPDLSVFTPVELKLIEAITNEHKLSTAKELELKAQAEPPYKMVELNEEIPYHLALYRNTFGEMDIEDVD